jgi:hypothetical protein
VLVALLSVTATVPVTLVITVPLALDVASPRVTATEPVTELDTTTVGSLSLTSFAFDSP